MKVTALSPTEEAVLAYIENQQDQLVLLLRQLLGYRTITPLEGQQAESEDHINCVNFITKFFDSLGVDELEIWEQDATQLKSTPGLGVSFERDMSKMPIMAAIIRGTGGGRSLILNGHYDVVPPGDLGDWTFDPFQGEVADGKMFGRGSCDMKGGIAAMMAVLKFLHELGIRLLGDVVVQIVPDEEMTCMGTLSCCQRGYRADAALIPEPTDMRVLIAMRGSFYGQVSIKGRAGHAEMVQPHWMEGGAVNAINKAQKVLAAFDDLNEEWRTRPDKQHALLDPDMIVPTSISSGGDWAVTYPDKATINFGVLTLSSKEDVRQEIETHVLRFAETDSWLKENPPEFTYEPVWHFGAEISEDEPIVRLGLEVLEQIGYSPEVCGFGSLTDAIHLINYSGIPTISIGPPLQPAHMVDEYVALNKLVDLAKVIALILLRWCDVEER